jgi:hypothetical protein
MVSAYRFSWPLQPKIKIDLAVIMLREWAPDLTAAHYKLTSKSALASFEAAAQTVNHSERNCKLVRRIAQA